MSEVVVWTGRSSQLKNFWLFVSCILIVPIPWAFWAWLRVRCHVYKLTDQRLEVTRGVLGRTTETLELYRVRDQRTCQSFIQRLCGLENVELVTMDSSTPMVTIDCIPSAVRLRDLIRNHVEQCRVRRGVRTVDVE